MKRISAALAVAALIGSAAEHAAAQSRGLGALAGQVSGEGVEGIGGVLVKLPLPDGSAIEAKTDESGKWNVNGVGKGEFHMVIYKDGFASKTVKLIVEKRDDAAGAHYTSTMTRIGLRLVLLIAIGATIGCDRVTKHVAATTLSEASSRSFLADTFRLEYVENTGAFLGLGANWPAPVRTAVFAAGNGVLLLAVAVVALRSRWPRRSLVGAAIFVAGGASNLVDRITYGMVIDFMNVGIGPVRTGIFNVADMAIMLGAGILVLEGYRSAAPGPEPQSPKPS